MGSLEDIKMIIKKNRQYLIDRYQVSSLELFGSYGRGEEQSDSDVDLLVEFLAPIDLFDLIGLEQYLSDILGKKVDLVMKDALKPRLRERILKEAVEI